MATGLLLGAFMPPHNGHLAVAAFARAWVDRLIVVMCSDPEDPIDPELRLEWLAELLPAADIVHWADAGSNVHDKWQFERIAERVKSEFADEVDVLFGSEPELAELAEAMQARYIPMDPPRDLLNVTAAELREDPLANWEFIPPCIRPHYVKRVCIIGPRDTGKTALAEQLAIHYDTVAAYAYTGRMTKRRRKSLSPGELEHAVQAQAATEDAMARLANRVLICDTDALSARIWSELSLGAAPSWMDEATQAQSYDQYLLLDVDVRLQDGTHQAADSERQEEFNRYRMALIERDLRYLRLDGDEDTRFRIACDAIDILIGQPTGRPPRPIDWPNTLG